MKQLNAYFPNLSYNDEKTANQSLKIICNLKIVGKFLLESYLVQIHATK